MTANVTCVVSEFGKKLGVVRFMKAVKITNLNGFARSLNKSSSLHRCACCDAFGGVMQDFVFSLSDTSTEQNIGSITIKSSGFDSDNMFSFYDSSETLKKCPYVVEKL